MTDDQKLQAFFDAVTNALAEGSRAEGFHWPTSDCFDGSCEDFGVFMTGTFDRRCNWKDVLILTAWFLKYGPDVTGDWMRVTRNAGIAGDSFHDAMLGVFIGGDGTTGWPGPIVSLSDTKLNTIEALELFDQVARRLRLPVSKTP